jgi:hypothetical protein
MNRTYICTLAALIILLKGPSARAEFTTGLINVDFNPFVFDSTTQSGAALLGSTGDI